MFVSDAGRLPWSHAPMGFWNTVWSLTLIHTAAASEWVARARCGLTGHAMVRHFEPRRMSLECFCCGKQSAGWTVG